MLGRFILGTLLLGRLASASTLVVPADDIFKLIAPFDQLDVFVESPGTGFMDGVPLDLVGDGADAWTSRSINVLHAMANGPTLATLDHLVLNLATKSEPVKLLVQVHYHGGDVRSVELSYDGQQWTSTLLPLGSLPSGTTTTTQTFNQPGSDPAGGPPNPSSNASPVPEPRVLIVPGLLLLLGFRRLRYPTGI
jgi:hypothetical protein